jgi:protein-tyrosine phosphatase
MPHIFFVCNANLYRSPFAGALFRRKLQAEGQSHQWTVESAGAWTIPGQAVSPDALRAARSIDIDFKTQVTRPFPHFYQFAQANRLAES